uniref:Uncharacterized protein n=1 Tax=Ananas comosus var. bracteatus TaxID=296719 RepID=A0A6V7QD43_ANACO|nr:unnamed protein product [Ananas comosus var. bracteatus]
MPFSLSVFPTPPSSLCLPCASPEAPPMPYPFSLSSPRRPLSTLSSHSTFRFSLYPLPTPLSTLPEATLSLYLLSTAPLSLALPSSGVSMCDLADCPLLSDRICGILSHRGIDLLGFPASDPTVVLYFTLIMVTEYGIKSVPALYSIAFNYFQLKSAYKSSSFATFPIVTKGFERIIVRLWRDAMLGWPAHRQPLDIVGFLWLEGCDAWMACSQATARYCGNELFEETSFALAISSSYPQPVVGNLEVQSVFSRSIDEQISNELFEEASSALAVPSICPQSGVDNSEVQPAKWRRKLFLGPTQEDAEDAEKNED